MESDPSGSMFIPKVILLLPQTCKLDVGNQQRDQKSLWNAGATSNVPKEQPEIGDAQKGFPSRTCALFMIVTIVWMPLAFYLAYGGNGTYLLPRTRNHETTKRRKCQTEHAKPTILKQRWLKTNIIPDNQATNSTIKQMGGVLLERMSLFQKAQPAESDPPIVMQLRNFYASCTNLTDIDRRGDEPLLNILRDLGGWPVVEDSNSGQAYNKSWLDLVEKFPVFGFPIHNMMINDLPVEPNITVYDRKAIGLPNSDYVFHLSNGTKAAAYYKMMVESAVMLGSPRDRAEKQMLEVFKFENSLVNIIHQPALYEGDDDNPKAFTKIISRLRDLATISTMDGGLLFDTKMIMPEYIINLGELMQQTDTRVVANYMIWRVIRNFMQSLSARWRFLAHSYARHLVGLKEEVPVWKQCLYAMCDNGEGPWIHLGGSTPLKGMSSLKAAFSMPYIKNFPNMEQIRAAPKILKRIFYPTLGRGNAPEAQVEGEITPRAGWLSK